MVHRVAYSAFVQHTCTLSKVVTSRCCSSKDLKGISNCKLYHDNDNDNDIGALGAIQMAHSTHMLGIPLLPPLPELLSQYLKAALSVGITCACVYAHVHVHAAFSIYCPGQGFVSKWYQAHTIKTLLYSTSHQQHMHKQSPAAWLDALPLSAFSPAPVCMLQHCLCVRGQHTKFMT